MNAILERVAGHEDEVLAFAKVAGPLWVVRDGKGSWLDRDVVEAIAFVVAEMKPLAGERWLGAVARLCGLIVEAYQTDDWGPVSRLVAELDSAKWLGATTGTLVGGLRYRPPHAFKNVGLVSSIHETEVLERALFGIDCWRPSVGENKLPAWWSHVSDSGLSPVEITSYLAAKRR